MTMQWVLLPRPSLVQLLPVGSTQQQLFSKASAPPQTIKASLDAPRTTDYGHEVVHTVSDLRKLEWARNPYIVSPRDWTHALGLGVVVLEAILYPEDLGFMDNLREETFWKNLLPLIQGKVFSPKDRTKNLVVVPACCRRRFFLLKPFLFVPPCWRRRLFFCLKPLLLYLRAAAGAFFLLKIALLA